MLIDLNLNFATLQKYSLGANGLYKFVISLFVKIKLYINIRLA